MLWLKKRNANIRIHLSKNDAKQSQQQTTTATNKWQILQVSRWCLSVAYMCLWVLNAFAHLLMGVIVDVAVAVAALVSSAN